MNVLKMEVGAKMNRRRLLQVLGRLSGAGLSVNAAWAIMLSEAVGETDWQKDFFQVALPIFSRATGVRGYKFPERFYAGNDDLTLDNLPPLSPLRELDADQKRFLVTRLSDETSYVFKARKSMRFYADYGLVFGGSRIPNNVFLVSIDFAGGRLVLERPLSSRVSIVNLDPIFLRLLQQLVKTFS